jgi:hypothetical protein
MESSSPLIPAYRDIKFVGHGPQTAETIMRNLALLSILCKIAGRARRTAASQLPDKQETISWEDKL